MANILQIDELHDREGEQGSDYTRTYRRRFRVLTGSPYVGANAVLSAFSIQIGSPYDTSVMSEVGGTAYAESDGGAWCTRRSARCVSEDGRTWEVDIEYGFQDPFYFPQNPLLKPLEVEWDFVQFEEVVSQTEEDSPKPVVNAAGDPFDPPVKRDDSRPVLRIVRNEREFNWAWADTYKDSINSDEFTITIGVNEQYIFPPKQVKVNNITARRILDPNVPDTGGNLPGPGYYWQVNYEFHVNEDGWDVEVDNVGFNQIVGGVKQQITFADGSLPGSPVALDTSGKAVLTGAAPISLTFPIYTAQDLNALGFA